MAGKDNIIDSAGAGVSNSGIILDSSKKGFTQNLKESIQAPQNIQEAKDKNINPDLKLPELDAVIKDVKNTKVTDKDSAEAAKVFKLLLNTQLQPFKAQDFSIGNMLFYRYDAKFKENTYDKSPLVLVLRRSRGRTLNLNLHWTPIPLRLILLKYILQMNKANIRNNMPLNISYSMLKPLILKLNLGPVIRAHIFSRISRRGLVVPPSMWLSAARLKSESFSGGFSSEYLYKKALQGAKKFKQNRGRREGVS